MSHGNCHHYGSLMRLFLKRSVQNVLLLLVKATCVYTHFL